MKAILIISAALLCLGLVGCVKQAHFAYTPQLPPLVAFSDFKRVEVKKLKFASATIADQQGKGRGDEDRATKAPSEPSASTQGNVTAAKQPGREVFWSQFQQRLVTELGYMYPQCDAVDSDNLQSTSKVPTLIISLEIMRSETTIAGCTATFYDGRNGRQIAQCSYDCNINAPTFDFWTDKYYETYEPQLKRFLINKIVRYIGAYK